jgi:hypothetical protein
MMGASFLRLRPDVRSRSSNWIEQESNDNMMGHALHCL